MRSSNSSLYTASALPSPSKSKTDEPVARELRSRVAEDPVRTIETNIYPTEKLLQLAVQGKMKFFLASTSEVYGSAQMVPIPEDHPLQGQSPYAASKASSVSCRA